MFLIFVLDFKNFFYYFVDVGHLRLWSVLCGGELCDNTTSATADLAVFRMAPKLALGFEAYLLLKEHLLDFQTRNVANRFGTMKLTPSLYT